MAQGKGKLDRAETPAADIEQECETWDWVRTAGLSAPELRQALRDSLGERPVVRVLSPKTY